VIFIFLLIELMRYAIVRFVDIDGIVHQHCLNSLVISN